MAVVQGVGYLIANDLLTDAAFVLLQPSVNKVFPGDITAGTHAIPVIDPSIYVGAQIACGVIGGNIEVVTVTSTGSISFTATFANAHSAGEPIMGATFPVRQTTDPLYTQAEMLAYLGTAINDLLTDCPLVYAVGSVTVDPTEQSTQLPSDCLFPQRVAYQNYPLLETSQSNLDALTYQWNQAGLSVPKVYFRDKVPLQAVGIWPRMGNTATLEVVYAQRQPTAIGLADGFLIPDPFMIYVLYKVLSYAFSKDGEARNPGLAKYFQTRYEWGVKVCRLLLDSVQDPNLEMGQ
jgi:hypothetical protein